MTVHLAPGFSIRPGWTQEQFESLPDPVASDASQTLTWPGIDIQMVQDYVPERVRLWWAGRPAPGTYPSTVVLDTSAGQVVVDTPIVVS